MGSSDVLVGGPTINILSESRNNAIRMLQNYQEALERWNADDQARFREWFGTTDETARQTIRDRTTREIAAIQEDSNEDFRLLEPAHNNPNYGAYVYGSRTENRQVFLGSYFNYSATPDGGQDSQSSMIVHEYSHFDNIGNTVDHAYGRNACRNLAQTDSTRALENADNFENWADSVYNNQ